MVYDWFALGPFWFTLMGEGRSRVRVGKYGGLDL